MITIIGATGHVGRELVARLAAAGRPVRAMTRRPDDLVVPPGVEVVAGDADDPASLGPAFAGAGSAFLMSAEQVGAGAAPRHVPALVDAARAAGVGRLVLLSVYSGSGGGDVIGAWNAQVEQAVTGSGASWTLLRPGRFMSNALVWSHALRQGDEVTVPFARRPAASIDPADIAAVAEVALDGGLDGQAPQLSGPEVLTPADELAALGRVLGRDLRAVEPAPDAVAEGMRRYGITSEVVDAILARTLEGDEGMVVLPAVEDLLGRPAATFADWAARHREQFARTGRG